MALPEEDKIHGKYHRASKLDAEAVEGNGREDVSSQLELEVFRQVAFFFTHLKVFTHDYMDPFIPMASGMVNAENHTKKSLRFRFS